MKVDRENLESQLFFAITLTGISDKNNDTIYMKVIGNFDKILTNQEKKMVILEQLN